MSLVSTPASLARGRLRSSKADPADLLLDTAFHLHGVTAFYPLPRICFELPPPFPHPRVLFFFLCPIRSLSSPRAQIGLTRITALMVVIPLIVRIVRKPHQEPERDAPDAGAASSAPQASFLSSPGASAMPSTPGASGFSKAEDEEWDRHKAAHRLIHDYSEREVARSNSRRRSRTITPRHSLIRLSLLYMNFVPYSASLSVLAFPLMMHARLTDCLNDRV